MSSCSQDLVQKTYLGTQTQCVNTASLKKITESGRWRFHHWHATLSREANFLGWFEIAKVANLELLEKSTDEAAENCMDDR